MLLLVTTGHPDMHRYAHPNLGRLVQPRHYSSIDKTAAEGIPWAADNDAFGNFDAEAFRRMLDRLSGLPGCLFVAAPDVVADAEATAEQFEEWEPQIRAAGLPVALVAQNGQTEPPWDRIDALFIGGDDQFKLGHAGEHWLTEARRREKWAHVGRVNTPRRIAYARTIGADSVDGTQWARWKAIYLRGGLAMVSAPAQMRLEETNMQEPDATAMVCAWCGQPAATTLVVEPAVYKTVQVTVEKYGRKFRQAQRRLITPERVAHACPEHAHPQLRDELAVKRQRRREAKEWAQHQDRLA